MSQAHTPNQVEMRPIEWFTPFANNPRTHDKGNVAKLVASIKQFGWTQPILVTGVGEVVAGHGRLLAARRLGMATLPCIRLANLTDEQIRAYRIADNQLGLDSDWDFDALSRELGALKDDFDISVVGFDAKELEKLLAQDERSQFEPQDDEDALPGEPNSDAIVVPEYGQIWELGEHRLACGDCTDPHMVNLLLQGVSINLMVTDPPYGVNYDAEWRNEALGNTAKRDIIKNDHHADWRGAFAYFRGSVMYVWHGGLHSDVAYSMIRASGFDVKGQIIWVKPSIVINRGAYNWQHEPCFYAVRNGQNSNWVGPNNASTVWNVTPVRKGDGEDEVAKASNVSTQKPVEVMRRPILYHTQKGDKVYDPFMGSGTTIIAAETSGRTAYGVELLPKNVNTILRRWQTMTGHDARCNGSTYNELLTRGCVK
jgi:DNA modification methylase